MLVGPTNCASGWTLQASIIEKSSVASDFLLEGQASGLGTVHPLFTLGVIGIWFLPLHMKRKTLPSLSDGFQKRIGMRIKGDLGLHLKMEMKFCFIPNSIHFSACVIPVLTSEVLRNISSKLW